MWTRRFCNSVVRVLARILLKLEVVGLENVPLEGPLILAMTHTNFLDPALAGAVTPREVVIMSKIENFRHPFLGIIVRLYGAFPVRRGEVYRRPSAAPWRCWLAARHCSWLPKAPGAATGGCRKVTMA